MEPLVVSEEGAGGTLSWSQSRLRRGSVVVVVVVMVGGAGGAAASITGLHSFCRYAGVLLDEDIFCGKELVHSRPLQALVAGLKAYSTWENVSCLQDCRECTGGMVSPAGPQAAAHVPGQPCVPSSGAPASEPGGNPVPG